MKRCERCGRLARRVVPVHARNIDPTNFAARPIPRAAYEAFGINLPWGAHPDDDQFSIWCEPCAETIQERSRDESTRT